MKNYTLEDLSRQAKKEVAVQKNRLKSRYALAKTLGFSPVEARILSFKSEAIIKRLAEEKINNGKNQVLEA